jgi:hypothetical protein
MCFDSELVFSWKILMGFSATVLTLVTVRGAIHVAEASAERPLLVAVGNAGDEQRRRQLIALRQELDDETSSLQCMGN